ncbi:MAG: hypothetical protein Q4B22_11080 [Eubacteriales bacterium]|nr:hypothetical protein [Eubacteriales bacterium]
MKDSKHGGQKMALGIILLAAAAVSVAVGFLGGLYMEKSLLLTAGSIIAAILAFPGLWLVTGEGIDREELQSLKERIGSGLPEFRWKTREPVRASVLGITRNLRNPNEKATYYIICRYTDPETGKTEEFTSRELPEYPGQEVIGKWVTVSFDRKGYHVDIEPVLPAYLRK